jgi:prepilin-type N-terminal cleavage/methylation domain-containing protein
MKTTRVQHADALGFTAGFSLIEVLVAVFIATIVFLSLAQVVGLSIEASRAASDTTQAAALAGDRLGQLTQTEYGALTDGGSVTADVNGFFEALDVDGDGAADYRRRWEVTDVGGSKRIRVRVTALLDFIGPAKEVTYVALLADK